MGELFPAGTLVRCLTPDGSPLRTQCRNHIFKLLADPKPVDWGTTSEGVAVGTGFVQPAMCLICGDTVPGVMTDFWSKEADAMDIAGCLGELSGSIEALQQAGEALERWWAVLCERAGTGSAPEPMRDFG